MAATYLQKKPYVKFIFILLMCSDKIMSLTFLFFIFGYFLSSWSGRRSPVIECIPRPTALSNMGFKKIHEG